MKTKRTATKKHTTKRTTKRTQATGPVTSDVDAQANLVAVPSDFRVYREWFEERACGQANCRHTEERIELRSACHPDAQTQSRYNFATGALSISCGVCSRRIAEVAVADRMHAQPLLATASPAPTTVQPMSASAKRNRARKR